MLSSNINAVHTLLLEEGGPAGLTQEEIHNKLSLGRFDLSKALDALIRQKKVIIDTSHPDGWNRYKADMMKGGPVTTVDVKTEPEIPEPKRLEPLHANVKRIMVWDDDKAMTYKDVMAELPWMRKNQVHSCLNQLVVRQEIRALDKKRRDSEDYPLEQYVLRRPRVTRKRKKAGKKAKAAVTPTLDLNKVPNTTPKNDAGVLMPDRVPELSDWLPDSLSTPEGKARTLASLWTEVAEVEERLKELMRKIHQIELGIEGIKV